MMACGAKGVISVVANIMPKEVSALVDAVFAGNWEEARKLHLWLLKISNAMFIESNPVPVKTALALMGKCSDEVRLPLAPMTDANRAKLAAIMKKYRLISRRLCHGVTETQENPIRKHQPSVANPAKYQDRQLSTRP
jgi:4-hydroxy-tetrahydrodipicolinate synthase